MLKQISTDVYRKTDYWFVDDVRQLCIDSKFYTKGTNKEYSEMLEYVKDHPYPTDNDILVVANDIAKHSDKGGDFDDIEVVAFVATELLTVVRRCFTVDL